jgi:hypothetical protein
MRTPYGKECRYFYGDYYRGRNQEECRLLDAARITWKPDLCNSCPVPDILLANACEHLIVEPVLERPFPFTKQRVKITPACIKTGRSGFDPHIGCGECHPLPNIFSSEAPGK